MAQSFADDPHSQDGQPCPRNYFGLTSYEDLKKAEGLHVPRRALELRLHPVPGVFDTLHLRRIHWQLFQDIFPWAGELRVVDIAKPGGVSFAHHSFIERSLSFIFDELRSENYLKSVEGIVFAERAAYYLGEINAVHPFREGNGRAQREFIRTLAKNAGHRLSWAKLQEQENTLASVLSHTRRDNSGLSRIITQALHAGKDI